MLKTLSGLGIIIVVAVAVGTLLTWFDVVIGGGYTSSAGFIQSTIVLIVPPAFIILIAFVAIKMLLSVFTGKSF